MQSSTVIALTLVYLCSIVASSNAAPSIKLPSRGPFNERECLMCRFSVSLVNYSLKTQKGAEKVERIANSFCSIAHIESPAVCSQVTKLFNHEVVKVLSYGFVTPDQICGYLSNNTCGKFHNPMADWEVNLNISISLDQQQIAKMHKTQEALREPQQAYRVIHISDTHIDLKYTTGALSYCDEPLCCRDTSKPSNKTADNTSKAGPWGSYGSCDVPLQTLDSALKFLNSTLTSNNDIDYIIWTGDIQPHDVWVQNKETAMLTYDAVFGKIFEYLPNVRIFPTLGNHEMVPVDSFSPSNLIDIARDDSPEWLYRKLDSFWSKWLPEETVPTITKDGFYATTVRPGLKIVSLNTNFCHNKNFWLFINSTDPGNQLQWLIHELQISELEHESVHIVGHIPPGADDCLKIWSKNYHRIVKRFSKTITGQFFGHTHTSEFEIFYDNSSPAWNPISAALVGPSITTFIGLNPSVRLYNIEPSEGFQPVDFETYYMNLTQANLLGPTEEPEWKSAGMFTKTLGVQDISPASLHSMLLELVHELDEIFPEFGKKNPMNKPNDNSRLFQLYWLYNSYSDYFNKAKFDASTKVEMREFLCRFFTGQAQDPSACNHFLLPSISLPSADFNTTTPVMSVEYNVSVNSS